jgi:hypothetical protein
MLAGGQRRVILDNTYPKRSQRSGVIETAWAHKVPVRCKWVRTSLEQARIHACYRMIQRHGKLLMPEDIRRLSNTDPSAFLPSAHHKYRRELEAPSTDEGFVEVAEIQLETTFDHGTGRAAFFDPAGLDNGTVGHLRTLQAEGYLLLGLGWEPSGSMDIQIDGLQLDIDWCVHPAGPPKCWCRKPLPGLAVAFIERHQLNPAACLWLPHASSDASLAKALGIPLAQPAP